MARRIGDKPLAYLDSAASTQKPRQVMEAMSAFVSSRYANVHRGIHTLSQWATDDFEAVREQVARHLGASESREIVFVRGVTEGINLLAQTFGRSQVGRGDEVLISEMEHHSNIVPWQILCEQVGATLKVIPISDEGELDLNQYEGLLSPRTRLVSVVHVSNALGTINPVRELVAMAHAHDIPVVVDGAQAVPHLPVNVSELGCDFYLFSGHKTYGPTGIGALFGKYEHLKKMPPYQGGGEMIRSVTFAKTQYKDPPARFEAGTPDIMGAIGLGAALDWLNELGLEAIAKYETDLTSYATHSLSEVEGVRQFGPMKKRSGIISFALEGVHPHDIGTILDQEGIAVRAGHHCAQPLMDRLGVPATVRASLAIYNTREEIDRLIEGILKVQEVFR